jgi:4-amino-4-deoxy-L-arabinose transferase-like glycosyltransferase
VLPILVGAAAGTLEIPRNDDWSYRGIAMHLYTTGRFELDGAAEAAVLGQVLFVQPLLWLSGGTPWGFLVAGILFSSSAAIAGYLLARRFLDRRDATLAISVLLTFPAYLAYSISYMTDVPALACQCACLGLAAVAINRQPISGRWLAAALAIGCLGFSIREFALAAPAAVIAVLLIREPHRPRTWITIIVTGLTCIAILISRFLLPGQLGDVPWELNPIQALLPPVVTVCFVLSPIALVAVLRWRGIWRVRDVVLGLVLGGVAVISLVRIGIFPHVLQYDLITQWGAPGADYVMGQRPKLFSDAIWSTIAVLALISTLLVAGVTGGVVGAHLRRAASQPTQIRARLGSPGGLLALFVLAVAGGLSAFGLVGWLFDRYLWPAIPPLAVLLLYVPSEMRDASYTGAMNEPRQGRPRRNLASLGIGAASILYLGILVAMSSAFLLNTNAFDGARWRAAQTLVALGYPAEWTDAGPEWTSSHQTGFATVTQPGEGLTWWQKHWPSFRLCAVVAASPLSISGASLVSLQPDAYESYLFFGRSEPFYLYRVTSPDCP